MALFAHSDNVTIQFQEGNMHGLLICYINFELAYCTVSSWSRTKGVCATYFHCCLKVVCLQNNIFYVFLIIFPVILSSSLCQSMVYVWLVYVQTHAISDGEISLSAAYKVEFAFCNTSEAFPWICIISATLTALFSFCALTVSAMSK